MIAISDDIILFAVNPLGFLVSLYFLIYGEYIIVKSIAHDPSTIYLKKVFRPMYRFFLPVAPLTPSEQKILAILAKKENAGTKEISHATDIGIGRVRRLTRDLAHKGYISRKVQTNDRRTFYYLPSHRLHRMRRYT